jgi:hypothetical protein
MAAWLLAVVELTDKRDKKVAKKKIIKKGVKKFIEEGYKLKGKINEATKKRMRKGNLKIRSDNPEVQAMLDDVIGKPTKIGVVTTKKGVPIIKDARGNVNKELTKMAEDLLSGKPKKMAGGGLATRGLGKAFTKRKK